MMKKATYLQPIIKVVSFTVESGFQGTNMGTDKFFSDRILSSNNDYATGERFTEYTDDGGNFSIGRWE